MHETQLCEIERHAEAAVLPEPDESRHDRWPDYKRRFGDARERAIETLANVHTLTAEIRRLQAENADVLKYARMQQEVGDAMFEELQEHGVL